MKIFHFWLQFASLDPKAHTEETPPPFVLAAVNGHLEAFALLDPHLEKDSENLQFELAQVWKGERNYS